jgi:hypothetical protein
LTIHIGSWGGFTSSTTGTRRLRTLYSRSSMLGMIPFDVLQGLCARFQASDTKINERIVLMDAESVMSVRQTAGAGMFMVSVRASRRNRRHLERASSPTPARGAPVIVNVMSVGIWLNGRQWKETMSATYTNRTNDPSTFSVGQIISFHVYRPDDEPVVIVRVWKYRVHSTWKGMWIVHSEAAEENEYISVDRIVHGLHPVVHWTDDDKWIGIPWWKSI